MLTSWPINGMRDTTEFPKDSVNVSVHVSYRQHLEGFCKLDGVGWTDYDGQRAKSGLTGADTRMRTFRKMYERLGLVTKADGKISLTWLGRRISKMEQDEKAAFESWRANYHRRMQESVLGVLARFQWKNPIDEDGEYPSDFDVQPCLCLWEAMRRLEDKISLEEVNRVILRIMRMSELEPAIEKIKVARSVMAANPSASLDVLMGPPVLAQTDTPCLHGLISFAGWGGLVISSQNAADGYRHLSDASIDVIDKILNNKPTYKNFADAADWMSYYIGEDPEVSAVVANVFDTQDVQSAFAIWLKAENLNGSGKAASYLTALDDVNVIIRSLVVKFEIPSVYVMPIKNLESLQKFLASEKNKENANAGSSVLNSIPGLHGISYWRDGHCGAAIGKLIEFKKLIEKDKDGRTGFVADALCVALKQFSKKRMDCDWCDDNTDNDATKPRPGYVANAKLRAALPMTNNLGTDAQVVQWFKDYTYPDGKSWLDGIDTDGCAAFGGYVNYLVTGGTAVARPEKFTKSLESAVKAIAKPESECFYNKDIHSVLKYLGLLGFDFKEDFDEDDYQDALYAQRVIKRRLTDMGEKQVVEWDAAATQAKPNDKDPDFLTVNEFLWFVKGHFKEINEEVVKMSVTPVQHQVYDKAKGKKKTFAADSAEDQLMLRILASLRTKPFVILAGHSGTGKSRMVKKLAYLTCRDKSLHEGSNPGNYCMIEVKPNWHDSTELLGYFSSFGHDHYVTKQLVEFIMKAYAYPDVPFFVCLDEMNLAPVEQYFAEFLSALEDIHVDEPKMNEFFAANGANKPDDGTAAVEVVKYTSAPLIKPIDYKEDISLLNPKSSQAMDWLRTHGLTIPKNLFVVGTVNMDESTNQFSRKVLDRAFTIEMTDARFEDFGDDEKDPMPTFVAEEDTDHALINSLLTGAKQHGKLSTKDPNDANAKPGQLENMNALKEVLVGTPFVVAYRFANEYALYEDALNVLDPGASVGANAEANAKKAFDDVVLMKLLPRIAGEAPVVKEIFKGREAKGERPAKKGLLDLLPYKGFKDAADDTASGLKMKEILNRGNLPYLTFWP